MGIETRKDLLQVTQNLQQRLDESEQMLRALRNGEVDAVVVSRPDGECVYTLKGADEPYRILVQNMAEGALTLTTDGLILFSNEQFAAMAGKPLERVIGARLRDFVAPEDETAVSALLARRASKAEARVKGREGLLIPALLAANSLTVDEGEWICIIVTDLSGQKRSEELAAAERLARSILDQAAEAILVVSPEGRVIRANGAASELAGRPTLQRSWDELFELDLGPVRYRFHNLYSTIQKGRAIKGFEVSARTPDGRRSTLLLGAAALRGAESQPLGCIISLTDISQRRQAEEDLRKSQEMFRTLADSIPHLAWMADESGARCWCNQRWYDYTGTTFEEVQGYGWQKVHHPDHVERVVRHFQECLRAGTIWEDTLPLRGKDGTYRWFLTRALPVRDAGGRITRWFGTNTDITEQREAEERVRASEERLRRLLEANIIGIVSADPEKILEANDVFLKLMGFSREELEAGQVRWRDITPPELLPLAERAIRDLVASGSCKPFETEYIRRDGRRVPMLIGAALLERDPPRWMCFLLDLTERKALERKLFEKQKLESIGLLAGGIAHDFNNLLVGIMGNASLARDMAPEGDDVCQMLDEVVAAGERAAHLTRQMLAYAGHGRFVLQPLDLSAAVREITGLIQPSIAKKVALHLELKPNLPAVEADAGQLQQVIMNLVLNASEAIGDDGGDVWVRTGCCTIDPVSIQEELDGAEIEPGTYVSLEVRDSGCGMEPSIQARIFDPFFSTKFTGRGLGLAAVAGIVRGHKGAIQVWSRPGEGSRFQVLFPAVPARALPEAVDEAKAVPGGDAATVLVVDDEETVMRMARTALERQGHTVLEATSGPAAIEILSRERDRVRAVLLDLSMPGMSGAETLPELRKIKPEVAVIVSSGYGEAEMTRRFSGQRISGFLQKPYTAARLALKLNAVLEGKVETPGSG